jgi:hypothetical protein
VDGVTLGISQANLKSEEKKMRNKQAPGFDSRFQTGAWKMFSIQKPNALSGWRAGSAKDRISKGGFCSVSWNARTPHQEGLFAAAAFFEARRQTPSN